MRSASRTRNLLRSLTALALAALLGVPVPALARVPAEDASREVIVALSSDKYERAVERRLAALGASVTRSPRRDLIVATVPSGAARRILAAVRTVEGVRAAAGQGSVRALGIPPEDPAYADASRQPRALGDTATFPHAVNLEPAWSQAFLGLDHSLNLYRPGVKVAVIDTGISPHWREDSGRIVQVRDYIEDDRIADDDLGHGTVVAEVIGAKTDNRFGIAGVTAEAPIVVEAYKVLDGNGTGTTEDTVRAIMDAADRGCRVINCSLGEALGTSADDAALKALYESAIDYARGKGSIVVAAAGNTAGAVMYPAAASGAMAVGSIDSATGTLSTFSAFGPEIDLVAPGQNVYSVTTDGRTIANHGTSFAAPIVSGSIALLWSLLPSLSAETVRDLVLSTAEDYPSSAPDGPDPLFGNGRLDVWAAYERLMTDIPEQADVGLSASPPSGFWTTLSWTPAEGKNVFYRYGRVGGPEYQTSATSARLYLGADGEHTVYVKEYASDRWANTTLASVTVTATNGLPPLDVERHAGPDRYATSLALSRAGFPTTAPAVVIATGADWPDALSAGVLARTAGGPLLLTAPGSLSIGLRDEIVRLRPSRVYIIGDTPSVSAAVQSRVEQLVGTSAVTRVAGANRYATAQRVAAHVRALRGGAPIATAVVASGETFPDALSSAAYASKAGFPILLTKRDTLPGETSRALADLGVRRTIVVGGAPSVSAPVARRLPSVTRIAGRDRYETSRRFAAFAVSEAVLSAEEIAVATGRRFPDALSASPVMSVRGGTVLLAEGLDPATRAFFEARGLLLRRIAFLGGPTSVPTQFEDWTKDVLRRP